MVVNQCLQPPLRFKVIPDLAKHRQKCYIDKEKSGETEILLRLEKYNFCNRGEGGPSDVDKIFKNTMWI